MDRKLKKLASGVAIGIACALGGALPAFTQSGAPAASLTLQGPAEPSSGTVIRDALGKQCLSVEAAARARVVNPNILDHVVSVLNKCPRLIKVRICYVNSTQCKEFDLQGYKREDAVLGSITGVKFFRYTIFQK